MRRKNKWMGWVIALGLVLIGAYNSEKIKEQADKVLNKAEG